MKQTEKPAVTADRRAFLKLAGAGAVTREEQRWSARAGR